MSCLFTELWHVETCLYNKILKILNVRNLATRGLRSFLDASTHLYKRVCPSVRRFVGPSVRGLRIFFMAENAKIMND